MQSVDPTSVYPGIVENMIDLIMFINVQASVLIVQNVQYRHACLNLQEH